MSTSKSHMYTANVWCCNMLNIVDVYFKVTHVYSKCDLVICGLSTSNSHMYTANMWNCKMLNIVGVYFKVTHVYSKRVIL